MKSFGTVQHISAPTIVTEQPATLIDHIIVEQFTQLEECGVIDASCITDHLGRKITDHKILFCNTNCLKEKPTAKLISYREYSKFDINEVLTMIARVNWGCVTEMSNVNDMEEFISNKIRTIFD